MYPLGWWELDK